MDNTTILNRISSWLGIEHPGIWEITNWSDNFITHKLRTKDHSHVFSCTLTLNPATGKVVKWSFGVAIYKDYKKVSQFPNQDLCLNILVS